MTGLCVEDLWGSGVCFAVLPMVECCYVTAPMAGKVMQTRFHSGFERSSA